MAENVDFQQLAATTEAHERFKPFAGKFRAQVKIWMGPGEPIVSTGTMVNELDLGGLFLRQTYTGDPNEGPFPNFEGRGFWGFNKATGKYEGFWIDNGSTIMQTETGEVDAEGKVWTMIGEIPSHQTPGETIRRRSVLALQDEDHHTVEMYFAGADGTETKAMEIRYERVA